MSCGIYKIENLINHKTYIGQSRNIENRWRDHKKDPNYQYPLYRAFKKYGLEKFSFEILEECSIEELDEREFYYIQSYNSLVPNGYNLKLIGWQPSISWDKAEKLISEIKENKKSMVQLSKEYNLSQQTLSAINNGRSWIFAKEDYPLRKTSDFENFCIDCGVKISKGKTLRCVKCNSKLNRRSERPSKENLFKELSESNFTEVGRKYGVSDNAIRKWCKFYGLPTKSSEYKK